MEVNEYLGARRLIPVAALQCGSRGIVVGMGTSSSGQHQGLVLRILGFRGRSAALLDSCFCIFPSSLDRKSVCASASGPVHYVVAVCRCMGVWAGGVDFSVVLEKLRIIQSPDPFPEHLVLAPSSAGERHGVVAQFPILSGGSSRSVAGCPPPRNDPLDTLCTENK